MRREASGNRELLLRHQRALPTLPCRAWLGQSGRATFSVELHGSLLVINVKNSIFEQRGSKKRVSAVVRNDLKR